MLPTLYTERLVLRSVEPRLDPIAISSQWESPEVGPWVIAGTRPTLANARRFVDASRSNELNGYGLWMMELNGSPASLGCAGLFTNEEEQPCHELECVVQLRREFQGQGLATEALRAIFEVAFAFLPIAAIRADVLQANLRSRALFARLGFATVSQTPESLCLRLDRGEWAAAEHLVKPFSSPEPARWRPLPGRFEHRGRQLQTGNG